MATTLRRALTTALRLTPHFSTTSTTPNPQILTPLDPRPKCPTPLDHQFESWIHFLKPGFTPSDVTRALRAQPDPDLAFDIFRWCASQRAYKHDHSTYLTMIEIAVTSHRHRVATTLLEEVLAGACPASLPLYNSIIRFCCSHRCLFSKGFDVYQKMLKHDGCKPNLETFAMLFHVLLRRFNKLDVCYVYLRGVRSLARQMKVLGVIPDTFVLNMIIKAYAKCLQIEDTMRVFREMGLYGCEPNRYTYSYLIKGMCEKGRIPQGLGFYKEMRGKELVPTSSTYVVLICSLSLERMFEVAIEIMHDMLGNSMAPDCLTYRTLLEELCRDGRGSNAFDLLEDFRKKDASMGEKTYKTLLNSLHFSS